MSTTGLDLRRRFLFWLSGNLQCVLIKVPREPGGPQMPYLERYRLFELPGGGKVYLHRFVFSDPDRGHHNHPWDSVSFPLVGQYLERVFHPVKEKVRVHHFGGFNIIPQEKFHRVELLTPDAWTLFFRGGTGNGWGFIESFGTSPERAEHTLWDFFQYYEKTDETGGWDGVPLGRQVAREPFRAHDRGHCL